MKLCECGCGLPAPISPRNDTTRGYVKGEPRCFINGHQMRGRRVAKGPDYVIDENGCWVWQRCIGRLGYGRLNSREFAHRHYYEIHVGPIRPGLVLDHLCRNTSCVNPAHLEAVTDAENIRRGLAAKLTRRQVAEIRASEGTHSAVAEQYGVGATTVSSIRNGRAWKGACFMEHLEIARDAAIAGDFDDVIRHGELAIREMEKV